MRDVRSMRNSSRGRRRGGGWTSPEEFEGEACLARTAWPRLDGRSLAFAVRVVAAGHARSSRRPKTQNRQRGSRWRDLSVETSLDTARKSAYATSNDWRIRRRGSWSQTESRRYYPPCREPADRASR